MKKMIQNCYCAFNRLKFLSIFLSLSDIPNLDLINLTNTKKSHSNDPVFLPLGKLMPSVDYFWKLINM